MKISRRLLLKNVIAFPVLTYLNIDPIKRQKPLRVSLIGHTGKGDYGHGLDKAWLTIPGVQLVAVSDPDAAGLANAKKRLQLKQGYLSYSEMLEKEKPDIVCIAPRFIHEHHDMVLQSIKNEVKGIYMEKPFCRNLVEAKGIVALCQQQQVKLALAHRNRYHPALNMAKKLIQDGQIGQIIEIRGRGKEDHRGGTLDLWVLGSHILNLVPIFTGKFTACYASMYQDNNPIGKADLREGAEGVGTIAGNALHARFETTKGIPFFFDSIQHKKANDSAFGFRIYGTKGSLDFRIDQNPFIYYAARNDTQGGPRNWEPVSSIGINKPEEDPQMYSNLMNHRIPILDLISSIQSHQQPLCNASEGLDTMEAIMAIFESQRLDGARVPLPLHSYENALDSLK